MVIADGGMRVLDAGCGSGRISGYLHHHGVEVSGIDLSPSMIEIARSAYPHLVFDVGSILEVDRSDGSIDGVVAWYSIIHTPLEQLSAMFDEFSRALVTGGLLLLAFQVGEERVRLEHVYGHDVSYDVYRLNPNWVTRLSIASGFVVESSTIREPNGAERQSQAYLLLRKS
jgi:ubiquinone/menaquinone biosynthesis C-methylase UbiE